MFLVVLFYFILKKCNIQNVYLNKNYNKFTKQGIKLYSEPNYMIYDENNPKNNSNVNHIGYDNRYPKNYTDPIDIGKIIKIFQQNKWLSILTNQNISINDKLKIVYIMDFYNNNSKVGNLLNNLQSDFF